MRGGGERRPPGSRKKVVKKLIQPLSPFEVIQERLKRDTGPSKKRAPNHVGFFLIIMLWGGVFCYPLCHFLIFSEGSTKAPDSMSAAEFAHNCADELLGVAEEHQRVIEVVQRVVDAGEARAHAALDHHDGVGFVHVEDGHAERWGWTASVRAAGLVTSLAPMTRATSVCGKSPLISSISMRRS